MLECVATAFCLGRVTAGGEGGPVLAQVYSRTGPDAETVLFWLVLAAVLIGGSCGVAWFAKRASHRRYSHPALFRQLCRVHELDRASCALLKRAVTQLRLTQPAQIFVEPKWIDAAAAGDTTHRGLALLSLRERLFGPPSQERKKKKAKR